MIHLVMTRLTFVFLIIWLILPGSVGAYSETTSGGSLVATVKPPSPAPNENITINLNGYGYDINQAEIIWFKNNIEVARGIGQKSYSFTNGNLGQITVITIALKTKDRRIIAKNMTFTASEVDLLWEADTYTPNFYKGASLPTSGSRVTVTAIPQIKSPDGNIIPSDNLIFTWRKDYKNLVKESGVGKDSISFNVGQFPNSHNVEVVVTSSNSSIKTSKQIPIPIYEPKLIIYPFKPLEGIQNNKAIGKEYTSQKDDESFKVEPFFWPNNQINNNSVSYLWKINDKQVASSILDNGSILNTTIGGGSGTASVEVLVSSLTNTFLRAQQSFQIILDDDFNLF